MSQPIEDGEEALELSLGLKLYLELFQQYVDSRGEEEEGFRIAKDSVLYESLCMRGIAPKTWLNRD